MKNNLQDLHAALVLKKISEYAAKIALWEANEAKVIPFPGPFKRGA